MPKVTAKTVQAAVSRMISIRAVPLQVRGRVRYVDYFNLDVIRCRCQQHHNRYSGLYVSLPHVPSPAFNMTGVWFFLNIVSLYML
jgi:hypothetical protein